MTAKFHSANPTPKLMEVSKIGMTNGREIRREVPAYHADTAGNLTGLCVRARADEEMPIDRIFRSGVKRGVVSGIRFERSIYGKIRRRSVGKSKPSYAIFYWNALVIINPNKMRYRLPESVEQEKYRNLRRDQRQYRRVGDIPFRMSLVNSGCESLR